MRNRPARQTQGFTLVELLLVIAIIGVLVGVAIPQFANQVHRSEYAVDCANVRTAEAAATTQYLLDGATGTKVYYFDAAAGIVRESPAGITGYGRSHGSVDGMPDSIPNDGSRINGYAAGAGRDGSLRKVVAVQVGSDGVKAGWYYAGRTIEENAP